MRIIRGKYKGRHIVPPKNFKARPTTDFAKEGLFNVLENLCDIEGQRVLDLFSGTGGISFEFVSRGAENVLAVEKNPVHFKFIKKMKDNLLMDNLFLIRGDALRFLNKPTGSYNIIFADPPYDLKEVVDIPEKVMESGILSPGGLFVLEHSLSVKMIYTQGIIDVRSYGRVNFTIFEAKKD